MHNNISTVWSHVWLDGVESSFLCTALGDWLTLGMGILQYLYVLRTLLSQLFKPVGTPRYSLHVTGEIHAQTVVTEEHAAQLWQPKQLLPLLDLSKTLKVWWWKKTVGGNTNSKNSKKKRVCDKHVLCIIISKTVKIGSVGKDTMPVLWQWHALWRIINSVLPRRRHFS